VARLSSGYKFAVLTAPQREEFIAVKLAVELLSDQISWTLLNLNNAGIANSSTLSSPF
jgi:hypothetical protein